jgi:hypothetical protein
MRTTNTDQALRTTTNMMKMPESREKKTNKRTKPPLPDATDDAHRPSRHFGTGGDECDKIYDRRLNRSPENIFGQTSSHVSRNLWESLGHTDVIRCRIAYDEMTSVLNFQVA